MAEKREKVVGILGGMGPEATVDLFGKIVRATPVQSESDHLRIIVDNNPKIPSRLDFVLHGGPSPVPAMQETARNLERAGADLILIGANTAHYFYDEVRAAVRVPVVHMIRETAREVAARWPEARKVGLLATTGTVKTRMYHAAFEPYGVSVITPGPEEQDRVMAVIHGFKDGGDTSEARRVLLAAADGLVGAGAQAILMGCTEVPVILSGTQLAVPLIDANQLLAEIVVRRAKE